MTDLSHLAPTQFVLYGDDGYDSHVVRLLLEEKSLDYRYVFLTEDERPEYLAELNPYHTLPILVNRDVALYDVSVIFEYLEERHQGHRLLPPTPKDRANVRLLAHRLQKDWLGLARTLMTHPDSFDAPAAKIAHKHLTDSLITLSPLFARHDYFMSDQFGWCDVLLSAFLWRLPNMGITLPKKLCLPLLQYQHRVTHRASFIASITPPNDEESQEYDS